MRNLPLPDPATAIGVLVLGEIATVALLTGGQAGVTVAAGAAGAIGGWLTRSALQAQAGEGGQ
jgi:hypothetical protein